MKRALFAILALVLLSFSAFGQVKTFTGPSGGNWHNPANWTPPGVPNFDDNVHIETGVNVNVEGLGVDANVLINDGQIDNAGHINVCGEMFNDGVINNAGNLNVGDLANFENAEINDAVNIVVANGMMNDGLILGKEGENLNLNINVAKNDSAFGLNEENGQIIAQGENAGIQIVVDRGKFHNWGEIDAPGGAWLSADDIDNIIGSRLRGKSVFLHARKDILRNAGLIQTSGGTSPFGMGNNIEIVAFNKFGTGQFINSGTVQGGNGDPGHAGDNIIVKVDNLENSGDIRPGQNGSGIGVYGGNTTINARVVLLFDGGAVLAYDDEDGTTNVILVTDIIHMWSTYRTKSLLSTDAMLRANSINLVGREIILEDLADSTIIATDYIELISINSPSNVIDFSEISNERIIVANPTGEILIRGDSLIAPPIGYNAMCEPDPTVMGGSISVDDVTIIGETVMSFTGHSDSLEVLIRNEYTVSRTFNYSITSLLGWFAPVTGTTPTLAPWETHSFYVHFTIPSGFVVTVTDSVTSAVMGTLYPIKRWVSPIIAFPFDTLTYLNVAETGAEKPEAMTISAHPNPFNSSVSITAP
ncbi:MAG: hypothetical protein JXB42_11525, partial [Deltaproteobacteria bacterium]|nr:hypothetical protein [Deltaproteobacteria bacterium]